MCAALNSNHSVTIGVIPQDYGIGISIAFDVANKQGSSIDNIPIKPTMKRIDFSPHEVLLML